MRIFPGFCRFFLPIQFTPLFKFITVKNILSFLEQALYVELLVLGCVIYCLITLIKSPTRPLKHQLFDYVLFSLAFEILGFISSGILERDVRILTTRISNFTFATFEHLLLARFISSLFKSTLFKKIAYINTIILLLLWVTFSILSILVLTPSSSRKLEDIMFSIELFLLACYCLYFYYLTFQSRELFDLKHFGPFWVITGLFFYCLASIPFFIVSNEILLLSHEMYSILFAIHYMFFSIFFLTIVKGVLCKPISLKL